MVVPWILFQWISLGLVGACTFRVLRVTHARGALRRSKKPSLAFRIRLHDNSDSPFEHLSTERAVHPVPGTSGARLIRPAVHPFGAEITSLMDRDETGTCLLDLGAAGEFPVPVPRPLESSPSEFVETEQQLRCMIRDLLQVGFKPPEEKGI